MRAPLRPLVTTDVICAVAVVLAAGLWCMTVVIFTHSQVTGFQPEESWGEVFAFDLLFSVAVGLLCRYRAQRVGEVLAYGVRVPARVERVVTSQQFTRVRVALEWQGATRRRDFLLWSGRRARTLGDREEVTLAFLLAQPRRAVIVDLYEPLPQAALGSTPTSA